MATGGAERNTGDDFRQTCGLCMESYRGRQPKLLPCFHTFCLPCLTTLTRQKESSTDTKKQELTGAADEISGGTGGDEGDGGDFSGGLRDAADGQGDTGEVIMFLCPTCRSPVRIPEGGVKNLQANFYLDCYEADDISRPVPCDLCEDDQKQDATHACEECRVQLCRPCRKLHDKFPGSRDHHVTPLGQLDKACTVWKRGAMTKGCPGPTSIDEIEKQMKVVSAFLGRLDWDERQLTFKKQEVTRDINWRYDVAVSWLTQARDEVLHDVTTKEQALLREVEAERSSARAAMETLSSLKTRAATSSEPTGEVAQMENKMENKKQEQKSLPSQETVERFGKRPVVEESIASFACNADAFAFGFDIARDFIGQMNETGDRDSASSRSVLSAWDLAGQVNQLKTEVAKIKTTPTRGTDESRVIPGTSDTSSSTNQTEKPQTEVSFQVCLTSSKSSVGENKTLIFDDVKSNKGGGYDSKSGFFRAPVAGLYVFRVTVGKGLPVDGKVTARLKVNFFIWFETVTGLYNATGSCEQIVKLNAGQNAYVQALSGGEYAAGETSFSGRLVTIPFSN